MIVEQTSTGKVRFVGITDRVIAAMTRDQLVLELARVQRDLKTVRHFSPRGHSLTTREINCLESEKKRIEQAQQRKQATATVTASPTLQAVPA